MSKSFEALSDAELIDIANEMMNQLMDASTRKDYEAHIHHFSKRAKSILDEIHFKVICDVYQEKYGFFTARKFVALFRRPDSVALIWKQNYSRVIGDYVAEMVMIIEEDQYKVYHAYIF